MPSEDVCEGLRQENRVLVGYGVVDSRKVIRLACVNPAIGEDDLDAFFAEVRRVADRIRSGSLTLA